MSENISTPLRLVLAIFIGLVAIVSVLLLLASSGFGGSSTSSGVTSTANEFVTLMPYIAGIFATGMVYVAIGRGK